MARRRTTVVMENGTVTYNSEGVATVEIPEEKEMIIPEERFAEIPGIPTVSSPEPFPAPVGTVRDAVIKVMETASDDHTSGTLVEYPDTRTWVFLDIDGPTVERAIREARKVDPDVTVARVISHVTGWAHDSGRLYRTVTKLKA